MSQHDCVYGKPKESMTKLLKVTSKFSKIAKCKVNIQKLILFLYISNEQLENEKFKYHL